jgi:hypothetical protein
LGLGVREVRKIQAAELLREGAMVFDGVIADRDDFGAKVAKLLVVRLKGG